MQDLTVTLIQTELAWQDVPANLNRFDRWIDRLEGPTDILILPEMFTTGFTMNAESLAQTMDGPAVRWLTRKAGRTGCHMAGSMIVLDNGRYVNRLVWARPDGGLHTYDKRHLFRYAGEDRVYTPGGETLTVVVKGWKVRPFICYDLRFPVWTRNIGPAYDLAVFVANWPSGRASHWRCLLRARAIENQCYVVGVNRVGLDGNGLTYTGDSTVLDPKGECLFDAGDRPCLHAATLSAGALAAYREQFPAWKDADGFTLA